MIRVMEGDTVVINLTNDLHIESNFHIIGQIFDKFYSGHHLDFIRNEETAYVPPGSAAVFEFKALATGDFSIVDHALFRVPKGVGGLLHVK